jgi:nucleoside-triphosphatase
MNSKNIFITGKPRTGKTTLVMEIIKELKLDAGGIVTPEIRKQERVGFKVVDLATGEEGILASIYQKDGPKVGKYKVNLANLDKISKKAIEKAIKEKEVIVIDEIGKMELFSKVFREEIEKALNSDKLVIAVLHRNYVKDFRDKGIIFELKRDNYEEIKRAIVNKIKALAFQHLLEIALLL